MLFKFYSSTFEKKKKAQETWATDDVLLRA